MRRASHCVHPGMRALRILIVDDDAVVAGLLAEVLEAHGHLISGIAATEHEAVHAARRNRLDLIIVDVVLGSGSGISAMEQIMLDTPCPHVFISGEDSSLGLQVLRKPFREAALLQAIDCALAATPFGVRTSG